MRTHALACVALAGCLGTPDPPPGVRHSWRELPAANQPGALHSPRMTWDETRDAVVLHGGVDATGAVRTTWALTEETWTEVCPPAALPALYSPAFAYDPIGQQLVLAGGSSTEDFMSPSATVFTCSSTVPGATWVEHAVAIPRAFVGPQLVHDGTRLLLVGGIDDTGNYSRQTFATTDLQTWDPIASASPSTFGGAATNVTYDPVEERILALKNYTAPFGTAQEATNELWQLGNASGHWTLVCGPPPAETTCDWEARADAALVHLGETSATVAVGGAGGSPRTEFAGSWILDNDELIHSHDDPPARDRASMAYDNELHRLVVYGGNGAGCDGNCNTTWILELD